MSRSTFAGACVLLAAMTLLPGCKKHPTPERWTRTFGGTEDDEGLAVTPSPDGGYVMAGYTFSFGAGEDDIYLIKTSATGNQLWTKTFGGSNGDLGQSVQSTSDGGYIIAGNRGEDTYLVKTDAEGNKVWDKTFGGGYVADGQSVLQTSDGGYVVLCETKVGPCLIKTDASGHQVWGSIIGCVGHSVLPAGDGGYVIVGETEEPGSVALYDISLVKVDASGKLAWAHSYPKPGDDEHGYSLQPASDGGYVAAGEAGNRIHVLKTDVRGNEVWAKDFGGANEASGRSIQRTSDGGYVIAGRIRFPRAPSPDVCLLKIDANGDSLWTMSYGGDRDDVGYSVKQTADGGFIITGGTYSYGAGKEDVWLIKTDSHGRTKP